MDTNNVGGLAINTAVIEKMAGMAALEVEGVEKLSSKNADIKHIVSNAAFKPVKATVKGGTIEVNIYICVKSDVMVKTVAEAVQANVKEKLQNMTGNAVTKVNVCVADITFEEAE